MILAAMSGFQWVLCLLLILVCVTLMVIILLQRGRGGGLSAAFGGGGGGSAFGAKTGDVFTLATVVLAAVYLLVAVVGNFWFLPPPGIEDTSNAEVITSETKPATPASEGEAETPAPPTESAPDQPPANPATGQADQGTAGGEAGEDQPPDSTDQTETTDGLSP